MADLPKPRYMEPCNGCGLCCKQEHCKIAMLAFRSPGEHDKSLPCTFLREKDGRYWCSMVISEAANIDRLPNNRKIIAEALAVGVGCTMTDEDEEVAA